MKVIGFDSWARGSHHYERLVGAFEDAGIALSLIHLGTWGNDPARPAEEAIGRLNVRDISYFASRGFSEILDLERPDAVLFLSTQTFAHRAFQRYCRQKGIPTVQLYHGLVAVQVIDGQGSYEIDRLSYLRFALSRLSKSVRHTWPCYGQALWTTGASLKEWLRFASDVFDGARGKPVFVAADDARTTKCCVYTAADRHHAMATYGYSEDDVIVVGNPDLTHFGLESEMIGSHLASPRQECTDVMYIDTGLICSGLIFRGHDDFVQHLINTRDSLAAHGRTLLFKPHPALLRTRIVESLFEAGIAIIDDATFLGRLQRCCASIVETTSLAVVPALLGMPVFLAKYGKLTDLHFGQVLRSYPRSHPLNSPDDFSALLEADQHALDLAAVWEWIDSNAGPLPASDMPRRVAAVFVRMFNTHDR